MKKIIKYIFIVTLAISFFSCNNTMTNLNSLSIEIIKKPVEIDKTFKKYNVNTKSFYTENNIDNLNYYLNNMLLDTLNYNYFGNVSFDENIYKIRIERKGKYKNSFIDTQISFLFVKKEGELILLEVVSDKL